MNTYPHNPYATLDFSKIGHGYRNICWMPGKKDKYGRGETGKIILFGYDLEGNPKTFKFPFCPSVKYEVKQQTQEIDLYNKYIDTKYFDDTNDRREWCQQMENSKSKIISCYNPEQEFLINVFHKYVVGKNLDEKFNQQPIRTHFIDIEVAIENEFPEPEQANYPINLITVYDSYDKKFYSWALSKEIHNTITDIPVELRKFDRERDLLHDYVEWHSQNYPDILTGWNTRLFDLIYIINRLEKVLGKDETRKYSPVGKYRTNIEDKKNFGKKIAQVKGISNLDLLFLYRDKFQIKASLDGGYNLNNVASVEIDDAKLHYDGSMKDFYKSNFQKFWEYNVQDVNLVVKLEEKLKLLSIVRKITTFGCSPLESIYTTISYIISSLDIYSRNEFNKVFLSYINSNDRGKDVEQYEGAFVFPTFAGLYKQGIGTIDVNSLYPSTARSLNISPETMVGKLIDNSKELNSTSKEKYTIEYVNGRKQDVDEEGLKNILDEACCLSRNNILFFKHEKRKGIFSEWCGNFFKMRKGYKKRKADAEEKLDELLKSSNIDENEKRKLEIEVEVNHTTQYALKILINSAYGTLGTTYIPIYDTRLAEAITLGGQFCNRSTSKFLNDYFKEHYGVDDDFNVTISGDTDSVTGDMKLDILIDEDKLGFNIDN